MMLNYRRCGSIANGKGSYALHTYKGTCVSKAVMRKGRTEKELLTTCMLCVLR